MICPPMEAVASTPPAKAGLVAEALHERDRELARRDHVGDARARDRAHEAEENPVDLGRAAPRGAEAHGDVGEELDHAAFSRKGRTG
jgi:predicted nucleotidyltransferase